MEITKREPRGAADANPWQDWIDAECARREEREDPDREAAVLPLDRFPTKTGRFKNPYIDAILRQFPAGAMAALIAQACCGWKRRPTATEAIDAIRARRRGERADSIALAVITESDIDLVMAAETSGEYSLQDIAWWIQELEIPCYERIRWLNAMARPE